ncbi:MULTISPECIES: hypothetical protein [Pseudomonas]|uniref:hypothetical protein n=1 Tax=Pseudomonas TaxID=286 RepID=UPI000F035DB8|nr:MULTISPECIES: hypothetical protein [Pseudomonas]MBD8615515.1 hypothetical protein [Pseudomonas putida]MBD8681833.1 hypothetical protein [Pseudomonas sp. CFBP 13719]
MKITLPTEQQSKDMFDQACRLIGQSQATQDREMLAQGFMLMRSVNEVCRRIPNGGDIAISGMRRIRSGVDLQAVIQTYRKNKEIRAYLELLLSTICPSVGDVTCKKHSKGVDTLLVKSLIKHDAYRGCNNYQLKTLDFNGLLSHLGKVGSREAFSLVLEECLRRLHEQSFGSRTASPLNVRVLEMINGFKHLNHTCPALPREILDVMASHADQLLAQQRKYPQQVGGYLSMGKLQSMTDHFRDNERMMVTTQKLVGASLYQMDDHKQLLWAEQLGVPVDADHAGKTILNSWFNEQQRLCALYYLLSSPEVDLRAFKNMVAEINGYVAPFVYEAGLLTAADTFNANGQDDHLFVDKAIVLLNHLLTRDKATAQALLNKRIVPARMLMKDHKLRDHLMGADLGL